jgi:asparagine synthase (glutamine-hydrolysing)
MLCAVCGIAGTVGGRRPDAGELGAMAAVMAHRGPDGEGVWRDDVAGLAFRRLAIIDLDERSNQPLHLGPLHLVFNGEIYNYRELREELRGLGREFVTEGDGEVLLHAWDAWGEEALDRVNGMFAFAVWHDRRRTLTLAADPFGEKPLYWTKDGERLVFGSDIRAILQAVPGRGRAHDDVLAAYLGLGRMPPVDESFFAGVRRLPAAHVLRFAAGRETVVRYWSPRRVAVPGTYPEAAELLRGELLDSIRLRLRSDVPVGTSLSGGVDSSAIVCLSAELAGDHRRHAFTARFSGYERDEWRYAHAVADAAGVVEHHPVEPSPAELLEDLDALVRDQEEPFGGLSIYAQWRVMRRAREAGVTVLLDGQGADELFGGYEGIGGWATRARGRRATARALAGGGAARAEVARAVGAELLPEAVRRRHRRGLCSPYVAPAVAADAARRPVPAAAGADGSSPLRRELLRQAFHTSLPELLRYADRDSMAHSREARLPFLDRRIAELALSLPPQFLVRGGVRKAILRDAVRGTVPDVVLDRRDKVGFEPPQESWLNDGAVMARIADVVLDPGARAGELFDRAALEADVREGRWRDPRAAWRVLNLELWLAALVRDRVPAGAPG